MVVACHLMDMGFRGIALRARSNRSNRIRPAARPLPRDVLPTNRNCEEDEAVRFQARHSSRLRDGARLGGTRQHWEY